ncbi:hypothetical protein C3W72_12560 [Listeria monocytogenes]|nr:hypothetical protein [Listeria monocytogenes]ECQ0665757.1 hypothetical protein [Listeria monocytogenes]
MTSTIKISEKDKVFQIATNNGWVAKMGTQVTIEGTDFAIYPLKTQNDTFIQVNEVESGAGMLTIPIDLLVLFISDTRDKAIEYYKDNVIPLIQKKIEANGLDKFRKEVEKAKSYMLEKYGGRPEIKDIEGESK